MTMHLDDAIKSDELCGVYFLLQNSNRMRLLVLFGLIGFSLAKVDYSGHRVYRAFPDLLQNEVINAIGTEFDLDFWSGYRFDGDYVDFRVPPELQPRVEVILQHNKIPFEIFIEDLESALKAQISPREEQLDLESFEYDKYHTYKEINNWNTEFTKANEKASLVIVGTGKSLEGRNMQAIKISTGPGKPAFVINCGIHAREWVTPATCMYTANRLIGDYENDQTVTDLMNAVDFYLIPVSNPDGYNYTWSHDRMWRKTRKTPSASNCKRNCYGVDPNRNWDDHWDSPGGSSTNCCSDTFRGSMAFSEIETQNQKNFVMGISDVKAYIDVHSYSQYWMYPYGWTTAKSPDDAMLNKIGTDSVAAIKNIHGKSYKTGSIANVIYVATGSTADYFYDKGGIKCSFAAELRDTGEYGFALPADQIIPTGEETFAGLMTIAGAVKSGTC